MKHGKGVRAAHTSPEDSRETATIENGFQRVGPPLLSESTSPRVRIELAASNECRVSSNPGADSDASRNHFAMLRRFRSLTFLSSMVLLAAFFIFAFVKSYGFLVSLVAAGSVTAIELVGGYGVLKSRRNNTKCRSLSSVVPVGRVPEKPANNEGQTCQHDLKFVPPKKLSRNIPVGAEEEAKMERVVGLVGKTRLILTRARSLEKHGLHSEGTLSYDRAARSALAAVLLSEGVDTQGKEVETYVAQLKRILPRIMIDDLIYLRTLRDQINKGYDATKYEARRAKEACKSLVADALEHLGTSPARDEGRN